MLRLVILKELVELLRALQSAADERDGDRIEALGGDYRQKFAQLAGLPMAQADDPQAASIALLVAEILDRQAAVEAAVQPWMSDLKVLFRERRNEQVLSSAYRQSG